MDIKPTDALIVVDAQNDFLPGGALPVAEGNRIFAPINAIAAMFPYVVATRDWHPRVHPHFEEHGGRWPYHCIQDTPGAQLSPKLDTSNIDELLSKGMHPHSDGYSAFDATDLDERLHARNVKRVFVCGLATDYCVKATALEAADHGFETIVLTDAVAPVNLKCTDEADALREMASNGIRFATTEQLATHA